MLHPLHRALETVTDTRVIGLAPVRQIDPDGAYAGAPECIEIAFRRFAVDHSDAPGIRAARFHPEERRRIVGPVNTRIHDDHALDVERSMHRRHFFGRRRLGRIAAPRP